jgi:5-methylcytosine-specific restriction endonuclease McrA
MPATAYALKRCNACKTEKPLDEFHSDRSRADGRMGRCRDCDNRRLRSSYRAQVNHEPRPWRKGGKRKPKRVRQPSLQPVTCALCSRIFLKRASEIKRSPVHHCTKGCAAKARTGGKTHALVGPMAAGITQRMSDAPTRRTFIVRICRCGDPITAEGKQPPRTCGCTTASGFYVSGPCHECGEQFTARGYPNALPRYCSDSCYRKNQKRRDRQTRSKRIKAGTRRETIDLARLAKRDGWRCHICKRKVTRKTWSHDHLIPLSDHGTHTWDNVALAHHRCNTLRNNTGAAQLILLG